MAEHRIVRHIARPAASISEGLRAAGTSTVYEAAGRRGLLPTRLRPVLGGAAIAGPAVTVSLPPDDNLMVHAAIECCQPGDILLVAPTAPSACAMIGELLATSLAARGVTGIIVDAGVRDVAALRAMGVRAWSSLVTPAGTTKSRPGSVNIPVRVGEVVIAPGDILVADDDGVVVVPSARSVEVLAAARRRLAAEDEKRQRFAAGVLGVDLYRLREVMAELGIVAGDGGPPNAAVVADG